MARPKLNPTSEQRLTVKCFAACGIPHEQIARKIGIRSAKTLRKYFRAEIDSGQTEANYNVAHRMYENATGGNVDAGKFWLIYRAGWRPANYTPSAQQVAPFIVAREEKEAA